MITNIHRAKTASDIQRYVRYTLAPKEENVHQNYIAGERVLDIDTQYISIGPDVEHNATSHDITNQIMDWNKEHRPGKKAPTCPALLGEFSFTKADKKQFYTESHTGERYLDTRKILAVCKRGIGMTMSDDRPMFLSVHGDTECLHVHFAAAMVDSHGKIWDGSTMTNDQGEKVKVRDYRQWELTNEKLEIEYGLDRVIHRKAMQHEGEQRQAQVKRPSNAVVHLANKGELAPSLDLAHKLEDAYAKSDKQFDKFLELAEANGIHIKPNMGTDKVNGLSFSMDGMDNFIKASDLGNKYKWAKLSKGLNYDSERDYSKLAELKDREASTGKDITELREHQHQDIDGARENQHLTTIANTITTATEITNRLTTDTRPAENISNPTQQVAIEHQQSGSSHTATVLQEPGANNQPHNNDSSELVPIQATGPSFEPGQPGTDRKVEISNDGNGQETRHTGEGFNAQLPVATSDLQEDKVKRRERSINTLILRGGYTREQAEAFYNNEQKNAEKKAEEPTWTPDKPTTPKPTERSFTAELEAYRVSVNRKQQSHTYGRSDDGLSM